MQKSSFLDEVVVTELKGVGNKVAEKLARVGIANLADVLFHLPSRYEDRSKIVPIGALQSGQAALFEGRIELSDVVFRGRRTLLIQLSDDTGFIQLRFFHFSASQKTTLKRGQWLRCYGDVRSYNKSTGLGVVHPEYTLIAESQRGEKTEGFRPVYPVSEGVRQATLRKLVTQTMERVNQGASLREFLPDNVLSQFQWPSLESSMQQLHLPVVLSNHEMSEQSAFKRLAFEELLAHHLSLSRVKKGVKKNTAPILTQDIKLQQIFLDQLGFSLTVAQQRVIEEIAADLQSNKPMQRLLQGDVGSGKTVVAACAAIMAYSSGQQVALMAPTELLAEQHFKTLSAWLQPLGIAVICLAGKYKGKAYQAIIDEIKMAKAHVIIGTQALFQEKVCFACLGLIIIDEQHRFGVNQRLALRDKGVTGDVFPHQLVMSATPIPRTLAMLGYADLDLSVIDTLPPGRTPITTSVVSIDKRDLVISRIMQGVSDGRQVYWVCTLIEESDVLQCQAAEVAAELLKTSLPDLAIGLVHGRMTADEKQSTMQAFKRKELDILVATTVIEVGVDVPNASLMIIENAERLGLAQLHQLRGRVGRGTIDSYCVLMYQAPLSKNGTERLAILRETTDGFKIAEKDVQLRGPGEVLGKRQAGFMRFKLADMERDASMLSSVAQAADTLLQHDPKTVQLLIQRWMGDSIDYADV